MMESPALKSTARMSVKKKVERTKIVGSVGFWGVSGKLALVLSVFFAVEFGFSRMVSGIFTPALSPDIVRSIGEWSWIVGDLNGRSRFLQNEFKGINVHGKISNCSCTDSKWDISQDGLLNSRCVLYKSAREEVIIWGWPLQTAGLLTSGFSSLSFTILSGRVTEWSSGKVGFLIRKANTSWVHKRWGASVFQLDPNTWILEYRRNSILENSRLFTAAFELLKYRISSAVKKMNEELPLFSAFRSLYRTFTAEDRIKTPT